MAQGVPQSPPAPPAPATDPAPAAAPPLEQAPPQAGGTTAGQAQAPAGDVGLQAAFTRVSQTRAAVAAALGIPKDSRDEDFTSTITNLRTAASRRDDGKPVDPETAKREQDLADREWRVAEREYPTGSRARQFAEAIRYGDPSEIAALFHTAVAEEALRLSGQQPPAAQAQQGGQPAPATGPAPEPDIDAGDLAGRAPRRLPSIQEAAAAERGTGRFGRAMARSGFFGREAQERAAQQTARR